MSINFLLVNDGLEETPDPRQKISGRRGKIRPGQTRWTKGTWPKEGQIYFCTSQIRGCFYSKKNTNKAIRSCKNKTKRISFLPVVRICWVRRNEYSASWPLVGEAKVLPFCQWLGHQPVEATQVSLRQWRVAIDLEISKSQLKCVLLGRIHLVEW